MCVSCITCGQVWTGVTLVHSALQEVFVQQFVDRQLPDQVETVETVEYSVQVSRGGATLWQQYRYLHR